MTVEHISPYGLALVKAFEGCMKAIKGKPGYVTTYRDSVGVLTIGYGHTNLGNIAPAIKEGDVWDMKTVAQALANDFEKFDKRILSSSLKLEQCQFDAADSFDFNTGSFLKSSIPTKIKAGDLKGAMDTLEQYNHAGGKVLSGLTRRRHAERLMFEGKVVDALKLAGAHIESGEYAGGSTVTTASDSSVGKPAETVTVETHYEHQETLLEEIMDLITKFEKSIGL